MTHLKTKRLSVTVTEPMDKELQTLATERKESKMTVIREAIRHYMAYQKDTKKTG